MRDILIVITYLTYHRTQKNPKTSFVFFVREGQTVTGISSSYYMKCNLAMKHN